MDITKMDPKGFQTVMGLVILAFNHNILQVSQYSTPDGKAVRTVLKVNMFGVRFTLYEVVSPKNDCPPLFSS